MTPNSASEPDSRDPALAAERTDLAWNRSALSLLACGALVLRGYGRSPRISASLTAGACILALGSIVVALGLWRAHRRARRGPRPAVAADLLPLSVGVAIVGAGAFVLGALSTH
jgi:uncharacterized membrane protein YidH (DUF202 family)